MKTVQGNQINFRADPIHQGHIDLVVAIIAQAVKDEGIGYLKTADGIKWIDSIGLDRKRILKLVQNRG